jgi:outer membrane usher protein FimD/PapC
VIIADVGQQGVPLSINGYDVTHSGRDGKALIPVSVAGAPQRVEIALDHVSLDLIPVTTTRIVTVRQGSGTVAAFAVQSAGQGAVVVLRVDGLSPPAGTSVLLGGMEIPVDLGGRAWLPQLDRNEILDVELPDGRRCAIATRFDGHGGPGVVLGPYECRPDR